MGIGTDTDTDIDIDIDGDGDPDGYPYGNRKVFECGTSRRGVNTKSKQASRYKDVTEVETYPVYRCSPVGQGERRGKKAGHSICERSRPTAHEMHAG